MPVSFLLAIIGQTIIQFICRIFFPEWLTYIITGNLGAMIFMIVSLKIVPRITKTVKWVLISLVVLTGITTIIDKLMSNNQLRAIEGVTIMIVAMIFAYKSVDELQEAL